MKRSAKLIFMLAVVLFATFCGIILASGGQNSDDRRLKIVATNFPGYDFARAVVGSQADIKMLVSPGAETHSFEPTPKDIIDIKDSDLFIYTGGESDEWIQSLLGSIEAGNTKTLAMMDVVDLAKEETVDGMEESSDEDEDEYDEHVWTSPKNAEKIVQGISEKLIEISPKNQEKFSENTKQYVDKLEGLDADFKKLVEESNRKTVVFGDRFPLRYFVDEYGLDYFAAFPGCAEQTEASAKTIAFLVDKVTSEKIPVIFTIELSDGKTAEAIAKGTGAKVLEFNSAHNISADDFRNGVGYIELMQRNLSSLGEALK